MKKQRIGAYTIKQVLGEGGMGIVFLAEHESTGEQVALKTVNRVSQIRLSSLRREIRALAQLQHPGIVQIIDEGVQNGVPWYAMEYLEGVSVRTLMNHFTGSKNTDVTSGWWADAFTSHATEYLAACQAAEAMQARPEDTFDAAIQHAPEVVACFQNMMCRLCIPLAYMHAHGIIHLDVKPENVIVRKDGSIVLMDFGLVSRYGGRINREIIESRCQGIGTMGYMAPEVILGDFVDARADIFSLGCVFFEFFTGYGTAN